MNKTGVVTAHVEPTFFWGGVGNKQMNMLVLDDKGNGESKGGRMECWGETSLLDSNVFQYW